MRRDGLVNIGNTSKSTAEYKVHNNQTMAQASFIFYTPQIQRLLRSTYLRITFIGWCSLESFGDRTMIAHPFIHRCISRSKHDDVH